ncbi:MAG: small integral rane protein [Pedosphaera sp.]|nr:small integral rane protein [Pedosphaera sp.]
MNANTILWIYIVLLVVGGLVGFLKAGSKMSLITSVSFAAVLSMCATGLIFQRGVADVILGILLIFFAWRLTKSKKFMPNGLMLVLSLAALVLRHV